MPAAFWTIPNVELIDVGQEWNASTGKFTVTPEDLVAVIAALDDHAVRPAIICLGHTDERFNDDFDPTTGEKKGDGQPAVGRIINLRLSGNGMKLIGDLAGVPAWLADAMPTCFPHRSIEAVRNVVTASGKSHPLMLTAVALLGEAYPAITTLEDIQLLVAAESVDEINLVTASQSQGLVHANLIRGTERENTLPKPIMASMSADEVRDQFYDSLRDGERWSMWIRQMFYDPNQLIVTDEDDGSLWRVPFTVSGTTVTFAEPIECHVEYVDNAGDSKIAASAAKPVKVYATRSESQPDNFKADKKVEHPEDGMTPEQLMALRLPEDATPEQISERIAFLSELGPRFGCRPDDDSPPATSPSRGWYAAAGAVRR